MVYIYYNGFACENWGVGEEGEYFECDDLIAPTIITLNRKGYKTVSCCSGHPYRNTIVTGAFIGFEEDYKFETLPEGFHYDCKDFTLEEDFTDDPMTNWSGMEYIVNINKRLHLWACSLPALH